MPTFGSPERFLVSYELSPRSGGVWMYGQMSFVCGGTTVGKAQEATSLRDALFDLEGMRRDVGKRENVRFWHMPPAQAMQLLNGGLFGDRDVAPIDLAVEEQWARHNICPAIDVFDGWRVFLIEHSAQGRLIFGQFPLRAVQAVELPAGEVDRVLEEARQSLAAVYERELGASGDKT